MSNQKPLQGARISVSQDNRNKRLLRALGDTNETIAHPLARPGLWVCSLAVFIFFAWAAWAEIDEVTRGEGRVIPYTRIQKIQSLEGGILEEILVTEGEEVAAGQVVARIDRTRFFAAYMEAQAQARALRAAVARLDAEVHGKKYISFPRDLEPESQEAIVEVELYNARQQRLRASLDSVQREIAIAEKQAHLIAPLVARQAVSELELLRLNQSIAALKGRLSEIDNTYKQEAYTEFTAKKSELASLENNLLQRKDQLNRTDLTSPVNGTVNNVLATTRGGVLQPGEAVMEILPLEDRLLIEARVKPQDIAFLAPGMPARVKITAYDYTIYGHLAGKLEQISADTIAEETLRGKEYFYQILIKTDTNHLEHRDEKLPIRPGMIAEVDVLSGKRTVLSYLLKPLIKSKLY